MSDGAKEEIAVARHVNHTSAGKMCLSKSEFVIDLTIYKQMISLRIIEWDMKRP